MSQTNSEQMQEMQELLDAVRSNHKITKMEFECIVNPEVESQRYAERLDRYEHAIT